MKLRIATLILCLPWIAPAFCQETPVTLPFEPAQLLGVLPSAPEGWKVLRSQAGTTLGDWLETRATRKFQAPPQPASAVETPAVKVPPPGEIEVTVVDTAGFEPALAAFADFAPEKNENVEKKLIGSLPAILVTNDDGAVFAQVLVATRYLVQLKLKNLPRHRPEDWLRGFHFEALPAKSPAPVQAPRELRLSFVDELQPRNNRSYVASRTRAK